ncbi:MAG TPA: hypothetical protein VFD48_09480 [Pyrinomonadaceae bacterium]|nr:hypothetical protein [Pyrinomonadaceae bacterium]
MSTRNVVIVTAVTIAAVVAIVVVVVLVQESLGGTPIIIKGGSAAEPLTTVKFNEEPGSGPNHPVKGEIQYIQILAPTGNCMVYKFSDWSLVDLDVTTDPDAYKISADDEIGSGLETYFENYKAEANSTFNSNEASRITKFTIGVGFLSPSPSCTDKDNNPIECPKEFPNQEWPDLSGIQITINPLSPKCP